MKVIERGEPYRSFLDACAESPVVLIEITSRCNFFCDYCISPNSPREKNYMRQSLFTRILNQLDNFTRDPLRLHIDGEPTLHPNFHEYALQANERGHVINLATNGSALKDAFLDITMDMRIHLSTTPEEFARRSNIKFAKYTTKLQSYLQSWAKSDAKQNIFINFYVESDAIDDREVAAYVYRFMAEAGLPIQSLAKPEHAMYRKKDGYFISISKMYIARGAIHGGGPQDVFTSKQGFCDSPWKTLAILQDGSLSYCCNDLSGATAFTQPDELTDTNLRDLWLNHPNIVQIREETLRGITTNPTCQKCITSYGDAERELYMGWGPQYSD